MKHIYYSLVILLVLAGIHQIKAAHTLKQVEKIHYRRNRLSRAAKDMVSEWKASENIFPYTHFNMTIYSYNALRILFIFLLAASWVNDFSLSRENVKNLSFLLLMVALTSPQDKLFKIKTPCYRFKVFLMERYKDDMEYELYNSISQLKNLIITQGDKPLSADFILEMIIRFSDKSKSILTKTLSLMQQGESEEASNFFRRAMSSTIANDFINLIVKLDYLNPMELKEQLLGMQSFIRQEKITKKLKEQEWISNIIFIPIVANVIAILINFIIITVWMDSLYNMLNIKM